MIDRSASRGERAAYVILRATPGIIFVSHGVARLYHASVPDFGAFLEANGLPAGLLLAWTPRISPHRHEEHGIGQDRAVRSRGPDLEPPLRTCVESELAE